METVIHSCEVILESLAREVPRLKKSVEQIKQMNPNDPFLLHVEQLLEKATQADATARMTFNVGMKSDVF